jgi:hypothetical protein
VFEESQVGPSPLESLSSNCGNSLIYGTTNIWKNDKQFRVADEADNIVGCPIRKEGTLRALAKERDVFLDALRKINDARFGMASEMKLARQGASYIIGLFH